MRKKSVYLSLAALNVAGYIAVIVVNSLANILPINGKTTGALSDLYPNLFTPAGFTFSIWGLIYILLAIFVIFQLWSALKQADSSRFLSDTGALFFLSCLANAGWIFAWHYEKLALSLLLMLVLLGSLIAVYLRLGIGKGLSSKKEKYLVHLPFSIYLGWITVATIANVTALLVNTGWDGFGLSGQLWAIFVIAVGVAIALVQLIERRDIYFCLVVDWALFGILMKRLAAASAPDRAVVIAAIAGIVLITCGIIAQIVRKRVY